MSRITFNLAGIVAFVAVAEKLNFRAAAESLHISQPALSRRIAKLEQVLGTQLFERTTQRVSLTEAGEQFQEHAKAAIKELELGVSGITESEIRRGELLVTLACVSSLTNSMLPQILKIFAEHHPLVRVRVIDESPQNAQISVASGEADFGLSLLGAPEPDIGFQAICTEDYWLAVHIDHALARRQSVTWEELADEKFIAVTKDNDNQIPIDKVFMKLPRHPLTFYEASHVAGALGMVEAGLGVTAVPRLTLSQNARKSIVGIPLTEPALHRTIGLIFKKGKQLPPLAMALYELLQSPHSILSATGILEPLQDQRIGASA